MKRPAQFFAPAALALVLTGSLAPTALRAEAHPNLPPEESVLRVLREAPQVLAARAQVAAETAQRTRLEAGPHEWSVRLGSQQRRVQPNGSPNDNFMEWNAALERPIRLPGKRAIDSQLGEAGVALAETGFGDALHESSRALLLAWFDWLRASVTAQQWREQTALLEKQAAAVRRRQALGDAARLDSVQADAALAQAQSQLALATARWESAAEDLQRRYPGLPLQIPSTIAEPPVIDGETAHWITQVIEHNHELAFARGEAERAGLLAERARSDRLPDPTIGLQYARERRGEENVIGAYISIPLPGQARRAGSDAALAQSAAAGQRAAATQRKIEAETASLVTAARASRSGWLAARSAAEQLGRSAEMTARAYQLGEGSLNELLTARRLANEAQLDARLQQLDALYLRYRLLLDTHQLWDVDG